MADATDGIHGIDLDAFVAEFGNQVLGVCRRHSANSADADDAYQRTMEVLLTKSPGLHGQELAAWASTVARNEALQIHRRRRNELDTEFERISETWVTDAPAPDERVVDTEQVAHGREALARINPDQTRCLLLRADGLGYPEICEITGFSYAKVNRLLSEGRKAFHLHVGMIDSGKECERFAPSLSMLADGVLTDAAVRSEIDTHLSSCLQCRASLRDYRDTARSLGAMLPLGALAMQQSPGFWDRIGEALRAPIDWLQTRLAGPAGEMHQGAEMALAKKAAIVVGVGASLVAGGAAVERAVDGGSGTTRESASPAIRPAQRPVAAVQTDRASHRDAVAKRDREQRAQAAERRQREAADATNAAAARPAADAAEPLNAEPAADPADAAPADAAPTDGQAEGLAP